MNHVPPIVSGAVSGSVVLLGTATVETAFLFASIGSSAAILSLLFDTGQKNAIQTVATIFAGAFVGLLGGLVAYTLAPQIQLAVAAICGSLGHYVFRILSKVGAEVLKDPVGFFTKYVNKPPQS